MLKLWNQLPWARGANFFQPFLLLYTMFVCVLIVYIFSFMRANLRSERTTEIVFLEHWSNSTYIHFSARNTREVNLKIERGFRQQQQKTLAKLTYFLKTEGVAVICEHAGNSRMYIYVSKVSKSTGNTASTIVKTTSTIWKNKTSHQLQMQILKNGQCTHWSQMVRVPPLATPYLKHVPINFYSNTPSPIKFDDIKATSWRFSQCGLRLTIYKRHALLAIHFNQHFLHQFKTEYLCEENFNIDIYSNR